MKKYGAKGYKAFDYGMTCKGQAVHGEHCF